MVSSFVGVAVVVFAASASPHSKEHPVRRSPRAGALVAPVVEQPSSNIEFVKPGSPDAKRFADAKKAGLIPVYILGGDPHPRLHVPPTPPYQGTHLVPHQEARGEMLQFQRRFVERFAKVDPQPEERHAHFRWIPKIDGLSRIGWSGSVVEAQQQPDGGVLVKIHIRPHLYHHAIRTLQMDYVEEIYHVAGGEIRLVHSDAAVPKPRLQGFPIH